MADSLNTENLQQEDLFYEDRFLESWAGPIITNPSTAIVELVANCWDAYATEVNISWPDPKKHKQFSISDNGKGLTKAEFDYIWRAMSYNRIAKGGTTTTPPPGVDGLPRFVFGKNGKGRFASFCLTKNYQITSIKDGQKIVYKVSRTPNKPLITELVEFVEEGVEGHGTTITGEGEIRQINLSVEQARELLGGRFLANPSFKVILNGTPISFADISKSSLSTVDVEVPGYGTVMTQAQQEMKARQDLSQMKNIGCFVAGTLVHTSEGLKPIEQIRVGDWVLSKPEFGEGEQAYKRVTKTVSFEEKEVWTIAISEKDVTDPSVEAFYHSKECTRIVATPNHPFWVVGKGWIALRDVSLYDRLLLENGRIAIVYQHMNLHRYKSSKNIAYCGTGSGMNEGYLIDFSLESHVEFCVPEEAVPEPIEVDFYNPQTYFYTTVYNFEVEDFHTYYVGTNGVWVHNINCAENIENLADAVPQSLMSSNGTGLCFTQTEVKKLTGLNKDVMLVGEFLGNMNLPWAKFQAKEKGARLIENVNNDVGFAAFAYCFNNSEN